MGFLTSKLVRWHLYSCGFHERTISEEIPQPSNTKINLKITSPKFLSNLLGANDFINSILGWRVIRLQKPYSAMAQVPDQYYILISAAVCSLNAHWGCVASFDLNEHELTWGDKDLAGMCSVKRDTKDVEEEVGICVTIKTRGFMPKYTWNLHLLMFIGGTCKPISTYYVMITNGLNTWREMKLDGLKMAFGEIYFQL